MMTRQEPGVAMSRRRFIEVGAAAAVAITAGVASGSSVAAAPAAGPLEPIGGPLATGSVRPLYDVVMAEGLTPPAAARFYHYTSLAMYEAALPAMPRQRSLSTQLHGLERLPRPQREIDVAVALSVAVADVATALLPAGLPASHAAIAAHRDGVVADRTRNWNRQVVNFSAWHGRRIAQLLVDWIGDDGYAQASTMPYVPVPGPDLWRSTPPNFGTAIEPHGGLVRPAALRTADEVAPIAPIAFDTTPGSAFHQQVAIARFWTDNPRLSGLPSGHWFLIVAQLIDADVRLPIDKALNALVRLGVALHDAFTNCWTWKYRYNLIRPVSYVQDHIDPTWATLVNSPQFPEYTSGHSVASGAAEVVLTSVFGEVAFIDDTGAPRGIAPRSFTSFRHAAEDAAISRLYGGIHYPMAIENGLMQGREIGRIVDERIRTRRPR